MAREAIVLSHDDPNTLGYAAHALALIAREYEVPLACMDRALQLNPNSQRQFERSGFHAYMGIGCRRRNRSFHAIDAVDFARSPAWISICRSRNPSYIMKGEFEKALEQGRRAAGEMPRWVGPWTSIAVAAANLGKQQEADAAVKQLLTLSPGFTLALRRANSLFRDKSVEDIFVEGMRAAGVPED